MYTNLKSKKRLFGLSPIAQLILMSVCNPKEDHRPYYIGKLGREINPTQWRRVRRPIELLERKGYLEKRNGYMVTGNKRGKRSLRFVLPTSKAFAAVFLLNLLPVKKIERWLRDLSKKQDWPDIHHEMVLFEYDVVEKKGISFPEPKRAYASRAYRQPFVRLLDTAKKEIHFVTTSASFYPWAAATPFAEAIQNRELKSTILLLDPSSKHVGPKPGRADRAARKDIEESIRRLRELRLSKNFDMRLYADDIDYSMILVDPDRKEGFIELELHLNLHTLNRPSFRIHATDEAFDDYYQRFKTLRYNSRMVGKTY